MLIYLFIYLTDEIKHLCVFCLFIKFDLEYFWQLQMQGTSLCIVHFPHPLFPLPPFFLIPALLPLTPKGEAWQDRQTPTRAWVSEVRPRGSGSDVSVRQPEDKPICHSNRLWQYPKTNQPLLIAASLTVDKCGVIIGSTLQLLRS